jgi:STE24 endopeptidase
MQAPIFPLFVGLFALEQTADLGLIGLNLWHTRRATTVPDELEGLLEPDAAERARAHALASGRVALLRAAASATVSIALLVSGLLPRADRWLDEVAGFDGSSHEFVLLLAGLAALGGLVDLPFSAWSALGVERRFGLSAATPRSFLIGRLKAAALAALLGVPLLYAAHAVMGLGGQAWWLTLFGMLAAVQVATAWLWPSVVALLVRQAPMPEGPVRDQLEALARGAGFPADAIRVVEASSRGGPANATLGGLGRPRLLLDDTLFLRLSEDQLLAVVAHELGHHRRGHLLTRLLLGLAGSFAVLALVAISFSWPHLYLAFGFAGPSPHAALALVSVGGGAVAFWLAPLQAWLSRRQELEADAEAVQLTGCPEALGTALLDLAEDRLTNPSPHPWFVAWRLSHPPVTARLLALSGAADEA